MLVLDRDRRQTACIGREDAYGPLLHRDFRWRGFCSLVGMCELFMGEGAGGLTSEVELALIERVELGGDLGEQLWGELHGGM